MFVSSGSSTFNNKDLDVIPTTIYDKSLAREKFGEFYQIIKLYLPNIDNIIIYDVLTFLPNFILPNWYFYIFAKLLSCTVLQ